MKWITILWFGSIFIIYLLIIAATTVPKAEQRERREGRENVQLICPKSLEAAIGDDITLDFHLESGSDATKWKAFIFECKQNSDNALVYKSKDFSNKEQANRFRGRVSPDSSWELSEGKLAWKISPFRESDVGTYHCWVGTRIPKFPCSTELKIKQVDDPGMQNKAQYPSIPNQSQKSIPDVTVTLVLATFALLCLLHY